MQKLSSQLPSSSVQNRCCQSNLVFYTQSTNTVISGQAAKVNSVRMKVVHYIYNVCVKTLHSVESQNKPVLSEQCFQARIISSHPGVHVTCFASTCG